MKILMYIIASEYILPNILICGKISYFEGLIRMVTSMIWFFLVFFVFLFEYYLNFFAEITRFGDREFYQIRIFFKYSFYFMYRIGGIPLGGMNGPENGIAQFMNSYIDMFI